LLKGERHTYHNQSGHHLVKGQIFRRPCHFTGKAPRCSGLTRIVAANSSHVRLENHRNPAETCGTGAIVTCPKRIGSAWSEENAEAVFQVRATVVSGRWVEMLEHTRETMAKDRRTDWRYEPQECLAGLNEIDDEDDGSTQLSTEKHSKRTAP
jgi:post-segregation antitoxin (ccd killing protein)